MNREVDSFTNDTPLTAVSNGSSDMGFEVVIDLLTLACAPPTVMFNALVLYIALRYVDLQQRLNQRFVVSMTVSDLLYGIVYMSTRLYNQLIPRWLCGPYYMTLWACQIGSVVFLLLLNVDKYISVRYPLQYPCMATKRTVTFQVAIVWLSIFLYCLLSFYCGAVHYDEDSPFECNIQVEPIFYILMLLLCYMAPLLSSLTISIYIAWKVQQKPKYCHRMIPERPDGMKPKRRMAKRIFFVFISTVWTTITFLPYRIGLSVFYLCQWYYMKEHSPHQLKLDEDNVCRTPAIEIVISIFLCMLPLGAVGNPLVTILTQNTYRRCALSIWSSVKQWSLFRRYAELCPTIGTSHRWTTRRKRQMKFEEPIPPGRTLPTGEGANNSSAE
uniref:G_PROTEIN_RECEP_F1_2 domain-containing protein n=1 Tax=Trichuris muris TaxID=70415 RepID=A0A5S6Q705_TRIMR